MSKLGKMGALAGLGTGISQHASSIRELWLQQAQEARADQRQLAAEGRADQRQVASERRQNTEADRREQRRAENDRETQRLRQQFEVDLEGVRQQGRAQDDERAAERDRLNHGRRLGEIGLNWSLDRAPGTQSAGIQKIGDTLYRRDPDGSEWMLSPPKQDAVLGTTTAPQWQRVTGSPGSASGQSSGNGAIASPQTEAEFNALPSGALYIDPDDGLTYRKP